MTRDTPRPRAAAVIFGGVALFRRYNDIPYEQNVRFASYGFEDEF